MKRLLTFLFFTLPAICCLAQTANDLNKQSKDLLSKNDLKDAVPLLKKAAEADIAEAQYNYGICYQQGIEVTQDDKTANEWFLKAAKQGWVDAQFKVAYNYAVGRGFQKNDELSFFWSLKCAQQNDPECMFNIVSCYQEGIGTKKNMDSMLAWAIRLALLPDIENLKQSANITGARKSLAMMYRDGDKVKKDIKKSYMWFLIYNESKRDFSIFEQQSNIDAIKNLEKNLTQEQKNKIAGDAELQIQRKLKNLDNLYKPDY